MLDSDALGLLQRFLKDVMGELWHEDTHGPSIELLVRLKLGLEDCIEYVAEIERINLSSGVTKSSSDLHN